MNIRPRRQEYDAIVVGSGMSGGWAAKELTELGARVLVLEAGPMIVPEQDYAEHLPTYEMPYRGWNDRKALAATQPIQRECYACDEVARKFFVNDIENPYTTDPDKPFRWIRGRQVGGRSIMWGRQCYRMSDLDFEANARDGHGLDWPIRYADLAPWYDHVEAFAGISGRAEGLPQVPDGVFLPPMQMSCVEEHVRDAIGSSYGGSRRMTIGRVAVLTQDHKGRSACHYCGPCHRGCRTLSYFSSINSTLPAAEATGRLTLRPNSVVPSVIWDPRAGRVTGVRVIDAESHDELEFHARTIFLAASALESARILLNSKSADFPDGLANSSGVLGKYLMDHTMGVGARANFRRLGRPYHPRSPPQRHLHRPLPQRDRARRRLPARLRLPGVGLAGRLGTGRVNGGIRRGLQARTHAPGCLVVRDHRLRRVSAPRREPRRPRPRAGRQVGNPDAADQLCVERQRARHDAGCGGTGGRDAGCGRRTRHLDGQRHDPAGPDHPRDGHGAHGARSGHVGPQRAQPGVGRAESVRR